MARPPVLSARIDAADLRRLDRLCLSRGLTRSELVRGAIVGLSRNRAKPDAAVAASLTGAARERYLSARRARYLSKARSSSKADAVIAAVADALSLPGGTGPDDLADAVGALRGDAALAVLGEVLRALGVRTPAPKG